MRGIAKARHHWRGVRTRQTTSGTVISPAASQVDDNPLLGQMACDETAQDDINGPKPEPVAPVYQGRPSLELGHEVTEEVRFVGKVQALDTALGDDAAIVCL